MNFGHIATLLAFLVLFLEPCRAEPASNVFQWQSSALSQSLPSCHPFSITLLPPANSNLTANATLGIPPYYMQAYPIGGTPTTSLIGTDQNQLSWTVDQPIGSQLLLTVIDSQGSTGGASTLLYTVTTGQITSCIVQPPAKPTFTLKANVTGALNTCQPWGLTVTGGTPPYNVSLLGSGQPVITNITLTGEDTVVTFPNRAPPGVHLVAAVSDFNGLWGSGTAIVTTQGSANVSCPGFQTATSTLAQIQAEEQQAAAAASRAHKNKSAVVAVVVVLLLLFLGGVAFFFYWRRRRQMQRKVQEISPRQFENGPENIDGSPPFQETGGHILSINSFITPAASTSSPTAANDSPLNAPALAPRRGGNMGSDGGRSTTSAGMSIRNPDRPALNGFPTASIRRSAKEIEAGLTTSHSIDSEYYDTPVEGSSRAPIERSQSAMPAPGGLSPAPRYPARSASVGTPGVGQEIIFQHQDAGLVRELPPPYADRGIRDS
ncbi:hypothetical protein FB45DRAFT_862568 [Roridomyces roridus]|uniref:Uncharacterized protein n=1 Tax=Roridomyces roridus TaxID=1738132 RepID=A0AAD7C7Q2_9AGAR|nr:hypothetical protein FB45DRAFT_862568 [Roridomyces roridus]